MTDLNTLIHANSNLYVTMANKINERGQISVMAIVRSGPDKGNIHAILLTPVNERIDRSVAEDAPTRPQTNFSVGPNQLLPGLRHGRSGQ